MQARDSRSAAKEEKVARPKEAKAQRSGAWSEEPESIAKEGVVKGRSGEPLKC